MKVLVGSAALAAMVGLSPVWAQDSFKLPSEVTPALRAACESDVRRHCVGENPTYSKVKSCVRANYMSFGMRCKTQIALAKLKL